MQKLLILTVIFFSLFTADDLLFKTVIPVKADKIFIDSDNNVYIISDNKFYKYNEEGKELSFYDSPVNEKITDANVTNPMKIMLYYKAENKILFLDNTLSEIGDEIQLDRKGFYGNLLISVSENGNIWIVDKTDFSLHKFNSDLKLLFSSVMFEVEDELNFFAVSGNRLYTETVTGDVFVNDDFGNFLFKIKKSIQGNFTVQNNLLTYYEDSTKQLISYNLYTENEKKIQLPDSINILNAVKRNNSVIIRDSANVYFYKIVNEKTDKQ